VLLNFNHSTLSLSVIVLCGCATAAPDMPPYIASGKNFSSSSNILKQKKKSINVSKSVWENITIQEREEIENKWDIVIFEADSFGIIIDSQSADESTPGTTAGATLGGALSGALYADRAIKHGSYSLTSQLAAGVLGAVIGSSVDSSPSNQYHFRYTVKLNDGEIHYFDEYKNTPFKQSVGICISVPELTLVGQLLCTQTDLTFREKYLNKDTKVKN
jgi:outer membrane lipoprotein SlyB